jgi:hypothetical protein
MANRYIPPMSDSKIRSLRHQTVNGVDKFKVHFTGLVDGLALKCNPPQQDETGNPLSTTGSRSWVLYYSIGGKATTKGFGTYPSTSTAEAVRRGQEWRSVLARGIDPREEGKEKTKQLKLKQKYQKPFSVAAKDWHDWQIARPNTRKRDYTSKYGLIKKHMLPELGDRPIGSIEYEEGLSLLKAIWEKIPPSAWKVQGGCKQIFDRAGLKGEKNIFQ